MPDFSPYLDLDVTFDDALVRATYERRTAADAVARKRGPMDPWRYIGNPGEPLFRPGWFNAQGGLILDYYIDGTGSDIPIAAPIGATRYFVDQSGGVWLFGSVACQQDHTGSYTQGDYAARPPVRGPMFTLPPEARPANTEVILCRRYAMTVATNTSTWYSSWEEEALVVSPNGDVAPGYNPDWRNNRRENMSLGAGVAAGARTVTVSGTASDLASFQAGRLVDIQDSVPNASGSEIGFGIVSRSGSVVTLDRATVRAHAAGNAGLVVRWQRTEIGFYDSLIFTAHWRSALAGAPA